MHITNWQKTHCIHLLPPVQKNCELPPETCFSTATIEGLGAVDEWFKSHAWKACVG